MAYPGVPIPAFSSRLEFFSSQLLVDVLDLYLVYHIFVLGGSAAVFLATLTVAFQRRATRRPLVGRN